MGYILGLDIGVASVGYAIIDEKYNVLISGVRLFREGTAEENAGRRGFRGSRRSIRRSRHRLDRLTDLFVRIFMKLELEVSVVSYHQMSYWLRSYN